MYLFIIKQRLIVPVTQALGILITFDLLILILQSLHRFYKKKLFRLEII